MQEGRLQRLIGFQDEVRESFNWDYSDDLDSAKSMSEIFSKDAPYGLESWNLNSRNRCLQDICKELRGSDRVIIIGAAVEKKELENLELENTAMIAADGSVGAIMNFDKLTCIISDLDGGEHIDFAASKNQKFVIHAHGDNLSRWQEIIKNWSNYTTPPKMILSHQTNQNIEGMHNFGGFTDGDRAVCFALWAGVEVHNISLIGFSIDRVGIWSGVTNQETKIQKLSWMRKVLKFLKLEEQIME
jgi:uncharacterized Rossmann fold enzyme